MILVASQEATQTEEEQMVAGNMWIGMGIAVAGIWLGAGLACLGKQGETPGWICAAAAIATIFVAIAVGSSGAK